MNDHFFMDLRFSINRPIFAGTVLYLRYVFYFRITYNWEVPVLQLRFICIWFVVENPQKNTQKSSGFFGIRHRRGQKRRMVWLIVIQREDLTEKKVAKCGRIFRLLFDR